MSSLLKIPVSLLLIFFSFTASGGDPYRPAQGAAEAGMGYVCIMKNGFWSSFHNQASLALNNAFSFSLNYENRFGISELGTRSAGLVIPAGKASLGAIYSHFGYTDFKRDMTGLACGLKLSEIIAAGVQIDFFSERTAGEYYNYQSLTFETGLIITPAENIRIGVQIFNPIPGSVRKTSMPSRLRVGAGTYLNKSLFTGLEAEMSSGSKLIIRTGFEYEAVKNFRFRSGFSTENNSFSFGVGWMMKMVMIDLGFVSHDRLGITSSASLIFKIR